MPGESLSLDKATNPRRIEAKSSLVNAGVMTGVVTFLRTLDEPRFMLPLPFSFPPAFLHVSRPSITASGGAPIHRSGSLPNGEGPENKITRQNSAQFACVLFGENFFFQSHPEHSVSVGSHDLHKMGSPAYELEYVRFDTEFHLKLVKSSQRTFQFILKCFKGTGS